MQMLTTNLWGSLTKLTKSSYSKFIVKRASFILLTGINKTNIHCIALMVKEREMIFYTFDFLSAGSDDDDDDDDR